MSLKTTLERFPIECLKKSGNHFGFGFGLLQFDIG